jgi:hypothetical protein
MEPVLADDDDGAAGIDRHATANKQSAEPRGWTPRHHTRLGIRLCPTQKFSVLGYETRLYLCQTHPETRSIKSRRARKGVAPRRGGSLGRSRRRIVRFSAVPFVLVSAAKARLRVLPVLHEGSKVCRSEAALGPFHLRALSISVMFAARSQG